jgi:hypothetical protein
MSQIATWTKVRQNDHVARLQHNATFCDITAVSTWKVQAISCNLGVIGEQKTEDAGSVAVLRIPVY